MSRVCTDELTIGQVKELAKLVGGMGGLTADEFPYQIGENYFIRTVTMYYTGKLVKVTAQELVLESAAWIADTGRFEEAIRTGNFSEVEPYPAGRLIIGRGALIEAFQVSFALPTKQK